MLEKVKIAGVGKPTDVQGKFGPQKKVSIKQALEGGDRWISGFIPEKSYNAAMFMIGKELELEVWQNGEYWNFKIPNEKTKEENKKTEEVMDALRKIYTKLQEIEKRLPPLTTVQKNLSVFDDNI